MNFFSFYNIARLILIPIVKIFFPYEIKGAENLTKLTGKYIICSNHLSNIDPIFLIIACPRQIFFMAKSELFKNKILGYILKKFGVFAVNRGKNDTKSLNYAENILKNEKILGIFIEGTRSKTGEFLQPKSGAVLIAYNTKSPIVPVCITGKNNLKIKILKKTIISIGNPILFEDLNITENSRLQIKETKKMIMDKIISMREN